jgi:CRISPR/Cas system-associated exonuclease Cas4 (RecB family)
MDRITKVSFSRLQNFEKCKYLAKLMYIDKVPEPERPLPPGKAEHANDRGSRVHDAAEMFVRGGVELISELVLFEDDFRELRELYEQGRVQLEGEWAVNLDWEPVAWSSEDAWARMKLDALVISEDGKSCRVIDYKTGKRHGNEIKHTEQGQIYQLATFLRFPDIEHATVEFWYTDLGERDIKKYTRTQGIQYFDKFNQRFLAISDCTDFPPNPNPYSCRWCPYKGNACEYGVESTKKNTRSNRALSKKVKELLNARD